jgi:predicted RNA-binding Zn ribbon-like protein
VQTGALFLAGQAGLDFLNTRFVELGSGEPVEVIANGKAFVAWLSEAGLLGATPKLRFSTKALDAAAAEARQLREWASDWVARWRREPGRDSCAELGQLNRLLGRVSYAKQVAAERGALALAEQPRIETASDLLALVALELARLVTSEAPDLVKRCEGEGCVLWFVDRTKAHRRRFCSAAACGNRAKVAAFREREREQH